jgi:hypothetical protein
MTALRDSPQVWIRCACAHGTNRVCALSFRAESLKNQPIFCNTGRANTPEKGCERMNIQRTISRIMMIATLLAAMAGAALAQSPSQAQIYFDTNVPYALTAGGNELPPGHYVLFQDSQNFNLFYLYQHDLAREPVAAIYALPVRYWAEPADDALVQMERNESGDTNHLVLRGFKVPYDDPWKVISVKVKDSALTTRMK